MCRYFRQKGASAFQSSGGGGNFLALTLFLVNFVGGCFLLLVNLSALGYQLMELAHSQNPHKFRLDTVCNYYLPSFRRKRITRYEDCIANGCDWIDGSCHHNDNTKAKYLETLENPKLFFGLIPIDWFLHATFVGGVFVPGYPLLQGLLKIGLRKGVLLANFQEFVYALIATNGGSDFIKIAKQLQPRFYDAFFFPDARYDAASFNLFNQIKKQEEVQEIFPLVKPEETILPDLLWTNRFTGCRFGYVGRELLGVKGEMRHDVIETRRAARQSDIRFGEKNDLIQHEFDEEDPDSFMQATSKKSDMYRFTIDELSISGRNPIWGRKTTLQAENEDSNQQQAFGDFRPFATTLDRSLDCNLITSFFGTPSQAREKVYELKLASIQSTFGSSQDSSVGAFASRSAMREKFGDEIETLRKALQATHGDEKKLAPIVKAFLRRQMQKAHVTLHKDNVYTVDTGVEDFVDSLYRYLVEQGEFGDICANPRQYRESAAFLEIMLDFMQNPLILRFKRDQLLSYFTEITGIDATPEFERVYNKVADQSFRLMTVGDELLQLLIALIVYGLLLWRLSHSRNSRKSANKTGDSHYYDRYPNVFRSDGAVRRILDRVFGSNNFVTRAIYGRSSAHYGAPRVAVSMRSGRELGSVNDFSVTGLDREENVYGTSGGKRVQNDSIEVPVTDLAGRLGAQMSTVCETRGRHSKETHDTGHRAEDLQDSSVNSSKAVDSASEASTREQASGVEPSAPSASLGGLDLSPDRRHVKGSPSREGVSPPRETAISVVKIYCISSLFYRIAMRSRQSLRLAHCLPDFSEECAEDRESAWSPR